MVHNYSSTLNAGKKPRCDATLLTLRPDQQKQVIAWLQTGSQANTIKLVRRHFGRRTSSPALSRFYARWHAADLQSQLSQFLQKHLTQ